MKSKHDDWQRSEDKYRAQAMAMNDGSISDKAVFVTVGGRGGEKREIMPGDVVWPPPGDVVWTSPGVKHWHGATNTHAMTHIAILEHVDGKVVDWMEHVTNRQYGK